MARIHTLREKPWPVEDEGLNWQGRAIAVFSYVFLFLCMVFPMVSKLAFVKASLLGTLLALIVIEYFINGRPRLSVSVALWTLGLFAVSCFFVMEGMLKGTPGAAAVTTVYIFWPLAFTLWLAGISQRRFLAGVQWTAIVATLFIGIYGCLYLLTQLNILPETDLVSSLSFGWEAEGFGAHEGFTQMQFPGLNSLPFLIPFLLAWVSTQPSGERRSPVRQICLWAACILGLIVTIAGTRRALTLVVCLSPCLTLFFRSFQPETEKRLNKRSFLVFAGIFLAGTLLVFLGLNSIYQFNVAAMWDYFVTGFDFSSQTPDEGAGPRHEQFIALVKGWLDHPFLGAGHGASAYGSIRSQTMPWSYELSYVALLFQVGIVGVTAYAAGVCWIFWQGIKLVKAGGQVGRIMIPMLVGLSGALIAHATNPYLNRFDGMWMLFLPLAVVNYRLSASGGMYATRIPFPAT